MKKLSTEQLCSRRYQKVPTINKYGLSRTIPEATKRLIRQKSKFGCVICRQAIHTYEHTNPVFAKAKKYDSENMCFMSESPKKFGRWGFVKKKEIFDSYRRVQSSSNIEPPNRHELFDLTASQVAAVQIGQTTFTGFSSIINIDRVDYLCFKWPGVIWSGGRLGNILPK